MNAETKRATKSVGNYNAKVQMGGLTDCWPWKGAKRCRVKGFRPITPQRVAWCMAKNTESITPGMDVSPTCGDAECCNPAHLRLVQKKPAAKRSPDMQALTIDIGTAQMVWLERQVKLLGGSKASFIRGVLGALQLLRDGFAHPSDVHAELTTAFRLAEGSKGRSIVDGLVKKATGERDAAIASGEMTYWAGKNVSENPTEK